VNYEHVDIFISKEKIQYSVAISNLIR